MEQGLPIISITLKRELLKKFNSSIKSSLHNDVQLQVRISFVDFHAAFAIVSKQSCRITLSVSVQLKSVYTTRPLNITHATNIWQSLPTSPGVLISSWCGEPKFRCPVLRLLATSACSWMKSWPLNMRLRGRTRIGTDPPKQFILSFLLIL